LELTITLHEDVDPVALFGPAESHLKLIREAFGVRATSRNGTVRLSGAGPAVNRAAEAVHVLSEAARKQQPLNKAQVVEQVHRIGSSTATGPTSAHGSEDWADADDNVDVYMEGRRVRPKSAGQRRYLEAIRGHDMVFCTGPAGTGKTYLAVAAAVAMLKHGQTRKLVLVRPAVEAGEKLGFLPGDMQQKVNPYLRPLLDALHDMAPFEQVQRFMHGDLIEVVPLAFMRGRTLNDAVIIMDEAQNTTVAQMQMFLTRMGHGAKMIVTGDTSQIDLPNGETSGLIDAVHRLKRVPGIAFISLDKVDIVRHSLVQRIVEAYGEGEE